MSALPSTRKTHSEKHKQIFRQLLKELPNKSCADCKTAQHPRWASWNLGCFICIRCSGVHRSMGTHISRVKSVDLDVWTDEQVESMIKWGNEKCNTFWEAKLPENYVPDGLKIENFIRTKYDMKKWAALSKIPDPMSISAGLVSHNILAPLNATGRTQNHVSSTPASTKPSVGSVRAQTAVSASAPSLLDDDFGAFASSTLDFSSPSPVSRPIRASTNFKPPVSTSIPTRANPTQPPGPVTPVAPAPKVKDVRTDLKKSILSLYSSPSSSSSSFQHHQQQSQPSQPALQFRVLAVTPSPYTQSPQASTPHLGSVSGLSDSLLGLNFGAGQTQNHKQTPSVASPPVSTPAPAPVAAPAPATQQWSNEWTDSSSSVNEWASASPAASVSVYNGAGLGSSVFGAGFSGTFGNSNNSSHSNNNGNSNANGNASTGAFNSTGLKSAALDDDLFKNVWS